MSKSLIKTIANQIFLVILGCAFIYSICIKDLVVFLGLLVFTSMMGGCTND